MKKYFFSAIFFVFCLPHFILAADREIILKFRENVPQSVINNFRNNFPSAGNTDFARKIRDLNINKSRMLFKEFGTYLNTSDSQNDFGLSGIFVLEVDDSKAAYAIEVLSKEDYVEYIELNNQLKLENANIVPNDPYFEQQYYLTLTGISSTWNITLGDSNIIIGVIDSGLDFTHPDLQASFKINYGEYGNGKESNGIDDDGNGFIDDWRGWDFVHAPFTGDPRRGDYLDPDNDPTDDNRLSHGTAVSGVISAGFNNNTGIAPVVPGCKVLVLRAFDAEGFAEEDDVSSAILYGLIRGVRVFNFSFGDYVFSNLLRDVIRFAYHKNVVIVTSSGNSYDDRLHYPSAYDEVISVGASDESDQKAGFSTFGETVDIYAPGSQILSTTRTGRGNSDYNGNYNKYSGTSFAAPQIAGIAAYLLSMDPSLSNEEVRGILVSSASYMINQSSWNHRNSSGRLNAVTTFQNLDKPSIARIHYPFQDFTFEQDTIPLYISAASPFLGSVSVMYGMGENPSLWNTIIPVINIQVLNDTIGFWNTAGLPDTSYTLRLSISNNSSRTIEHRMIIFKDRNPPEITNINFGNIIDKNNYSQIILFETNKRTLGRVYYKKKNSTEPYQFVLADVGTPNIGFVTQVHMAIIPDNSLIPEADYEFYLEAVSLNGKKVIKTDPSFGFRTRSEINSYGYTQKPYSLTFSQSARTILDITGNGKSDVFINEIKNNLMLNVYEFSNDRFIKISNNNWGDFKVARDVADINGNGKIDLLASRSLDGFLYEAPAPGSLPVNLIWSDSGNSNFWSSRFADTDSDGKMEFLGFADTVLKIMEAESEYNIIETAALPYFGADPDVNSQNVLVEDFDNDGKNEICFVNLYSRYSNQVIPDIALNIFKNTSDNNYLRIFTDTLPRFLKGNNIVAGDFDGDGNKDIAIGTISKDGELVQYYSLYVYKATGTSSFSLLDVVDIFNYKTYTETSLQAGNIDEGQQEEILINTGTHFYILKYDNSENRFMPVFYKEGINTNNQIVFDFDKNGINEIGLNTINDTLLFFEKDVSFAGPLTPANVEGYSVDSNLVRITFLPVAGADMYYVYRTDSSSAMELYDSVNTAEFSDVNVSNRTVYRYRISAVDYHKKVHESVLSNEISVYVHNRSKLVSAKLEGLSNVSIKFSERIQYSIPNLNSFVVMSAVRGSSGDVIHPDNIAVKNDYEYFLLFDNIAAGEYSIHTTGLRDFYNSSVDSNIVQFTVNDIPDSVSFYLVALNLAGRLSLKAEFNLNVDSSSVTNKNNYSLEPFDIGILNIEIDQLDRKTIYLTLENKAPIAATGKNYILRIKDIFSEDGTKIVDGAGSSFGMTFNRENLDELYIYPNPYSISSGQDYITFANLTRTAVIRIYDLTGKFIREIEETDGNGGVEWDLKDNSGREVSTGIYFFNAEGVNSSGEKAGEKFGKFAVVK